MSTSDSSVPRWHQLGVRAGLVAAGIVVFLDIIIIYWIDPFDLITEEYPVGPMDFALTVTYTISQAILVGISIWFMAGRRVARLAEAARRSAEASAEAAVFEDAGHDEIAALARTLNETRTKLRKSLLELEQRDERRRDWLAQVSHDLRTPLTALITSLDHVSTVLDSESEAAEVIDSARWDADRIRALTEDLLEATRLEGNEVPIVREPVPVGELVRKTVHGLEPLARSRGMEIVVDVDPDLPSLSADGRLLTRALENLLSNSLRHARSEIRVSALPAQDSVRFLVEDDGAGINGHTGTKFSLDEVRRARTHSGTHGLGLLVTERVAQVHGGHAGASNRDPGGAAVWFTIPVVEQS